MYVYVYMRVCMYMYVYVYTYMYVCIYMCVCVYIYGPRPKAKGHYGCPKVDTLAIPLQATINLFINWLLDLTLIPSLTRPLWDLLGHYGFY